MNEVLILVLEENENYTSPKGKKLFKTFHINVKSKTNMKIFNQWMDFLYGDFDSFLFGKPAKDLIIKHKGKIVGFGNSVPVEIIRDPIDNELTIKMSYEKELDNDHPEFRLETRQRKLQIIEDECSTTNSYFKN